ncbi:hypothetical protein [Streptomyces sp. Je 1-79]|uniref:hypothetical protein n=1 Tax=Streptomyces sp. Je 1-79 TaxID=2943847 RepID=UPI0027E47DA2|nr:hypothetical protein [Streptomyces sp. Je 1-79]
MGARRAKSRSTSAVSSSGRTGGPTLVRLSPAAADAENGRRLWEMSERLTDLRFDVRARAAE